MAQYSVTLQYDGKYLLLSGYRIALHPYEASSFIVDTEKPGLYCLGSGFNVDKDYYLHTGFPGQLSGVWPSNSGYDVEFIFYDGENYYGCSTQIDDGTTYIRACELKNNIRFSVSDGRIGS